LLSDREGQNDVERGQRMLEGGKFDVGSTESCTLLVGYWGIEYVAMLWGVVMTLGDAGVLATEHDILEG
jgi:hypothetical protein